MESQMLYRGLAPYYDLIYSQKDYAKEGAILKEIIERHKVSNGVDLLDVGCGTGHHLNRLVDAFNCTGVDINGEMLELARKNVEGAEFIEADMITMDLERRARASFFYFQEQEKITHNGKKELFLDKRGK